MFAEYTNTHKIATYITLPIAHARTKGKPHGRPVTVRNRSDEVTSMYKRGLSQSEIARQLGIGRTSVRRILNSTASLIAKK